MLKSSTKADDSKFKEEIPSTADDSKFKEEKISTTVDATREENNVDEENKKKPPSSAGSTKKNNDAIDTGKDATKEISDNVRIQLLKNERARIKRWDNVFKGSPGLMWGVLLFLGFLTMKVAGNPTDDMQIKEIPITKLLSSPNTNTPFTIYSLDSLETNSYQFKLNEIRLEIISGIESACQAIRALKETCNEHPTMKTPSKRMPNQCIQWKDYVKLQITPPRMKSSIVATKA